MRASYLSRQSSVSRPSMAAAISRHGLDFSFRPRRRMSWMSVQAGGSGVGEGGFTAAGSGSGSGAVS